jgi:hypothetical protein
VGRWPANAGNSKDFRDFHHPKGYYHYYTPKGKRVLASIVDLQYTNSALERVGGHFGA